MPRILALDLSLRNVGICTADQTLLTFSAKTDGDERLDEIAERVRDLAVLAELVVMEDLLFMTQKAGQLGMVHGAVRLQLMRKEIPYVVVSAAALKKYATGKGNAKKEEMIVHWNKRSGQMVTDNNQADAAWLHAMAKDFYKEPLFAVTLAQRLMLGKVAWPELKKKPVPNICRKCGATDKTLKGGAVWISAELCSECDEAPGLLPIDKVLQTINDPERAA